MDDLQLVLVQEPRPGAQSSSSDSARPVMTDVTPPTNSSTGATGNHFDRHTAQHGTAAPYWQRWLAAVS